MTNWNTVKTRKDLIIQIDKLGLRGYACEVGVFTGKFSEYILKNWNGKKIYLVDPWEHQKDIHQDASNVSDEEHLQAYHECQRIMRGYIKEDRAEILREYSVEAAKKFDNEYFDFVYIDARHDYRSVFNDISAWYPKVKTGGIIAGHDYFYRNSRRNLVETLHAVKDFFRERHDIYNTEENLPSWYVEKI